MKQLGLLDRILLGRTFTIGMNLFVLAIVAPITFDQALDWFAQVRVALGLALRDDELGSAFAKQGAVGVVLVALGVILEGRHTFLLRVKKVHHIEHLPGQEEFCDLCELFGFYILVLGLLIECFGEIVKFFDTRHPLALLAVSGVSILLEAVAVLFLLRLIGKVCVLRLSDG